MKHFCIIVNAGKDESMQTAYRIKAEIETKGGTAQLLPTKPEGGLCGEGFTDVSSLLPETEAALVLGGDGTVIQAARELAGYELPIMGINLGTLGFLTEVELEHVPEAIGLLLAGQYRLEERIMLSGTVYQAGKAVYTAEALNDIVISRSGYSRIVSMQVAVNGQLLTHYRGDGVILSTPTGSTAYNLSAGGPVILPEGRAFAITPICAHSLEIRSIVASAEDCVRIEIAQSKKSQKEEAIVSFDGNTGILLETGDMVEIKKAVQQTRFIRIGSRGILENLRMLWNGGRNEGEETG